MRLASANGVSVDFAVVAVLEEPVGTLSFRKQEHFEQYSDTSRLSEGSAACTP